MLLLVLILVLIAFGLLLVGFLSSSVMWAWVSVAVSVVAALVLLYDTLQRRSAVRAGDEAGAGSGGTTGPSTGEWPLGATPGGPVDGAREFGARPARSEIDPVTEVIPVIRPSGAGPESWTQVVDPRFDPDADSQQTVMMPAVGPSGSPVGPSGATSAITPSSDSVSPTVVVAELDMSGSGGGDTPPADAGTVATPAAQTPPDAATTPADDVGGPSRTSAVAGAAGLAAAAAATTAIDRSSADTPPQDAGAPKDVSPRDLSLTKGAAPSTDDAAGPSQETRATSTTEAVADASSAATVAPVVGGPARNTVPPAGSAPAGTDPDSLFSSPSDSRSTGPGAGGFGPSGFGSGAGRPEKKPVDTQIVPAAPRAGSTPVSAAAAGAVGAAAAGAPGTGPGGSGPAATVNGSNAGNGSTPPPAGPPPAEATTILDPNRATAATDASPPTDPPAVDGEEPEEQPAAAAAALVATLEDEVLVIDEKPRYHVPGCRTLVAAALIPLPAREAVELGFTPCGWCSPDRTLAGRHPATAR